MELFFYGTLMDVDVLRIVLGRPIAADRLTPASLSGWRRVRALREAYPIVLADPAAAVDGVVLGGLSPGDVAKLNRYEGDGYDLVDCMVEVGPERRAARFYRPRAALKADPEPWDFAGWQAREKAAFLNRISRKPVA